MVLYVVPGTIPSGTPYDSSIFNREQERKDADSGEGTFADLIFKTL
jgi:hypothetical protein